MRLRVSGQHTGTEYDMHSVVEGATDTSGLPQGDLMNAFAEGICNRNPTQTEAARKGIVDTLGEAAMVDAAAVIALSSRTELNPSHAFELVAASSRTTMY